MESFQYNGDMVDRNGKPYAPEWALEALKKGTMYYKNDGQLYIKSAAGDKLVSVGDCIFKDEVVKS